MIDINFSTSQTFSMNLGMCRKIPKKILALQNDVMMTSSIVLVLVKIRLFVQFNHIQLRFTQCYCPLTLKQIRQSDR